MNSSQHIHTHPSVSIHPIQPIHFWLPPWRPSWSKPWVTPGLLSSHVRNSKHS